MESATVKKSSKFAAEARDRNKVTDLSQNNSEHLKCSLYL